MKEPRKKELYNKIKEVIEALNIEEGEGGIASILCTLLGALVMGPKHLRLLVSAVSECGQRLEDDLKSSEE